MSDNIYDKYNVDVSRLKRDYLKNPLKKHYDKYPYYWDNPDKNDCQYLFIECNIPAKELITLFGFSSIKLIRILREYGIKKSPKLVQKNVESRLQEKYGVNNFSLSIDKLKMAVEKRKQRYGDEVSKIIENKEILNKYIIDNKVRSCKELSKLFEIEYEVIRKIVAKYKLQDSFSRVYTKEEDDVYNLLKMKFNDVKRQYKSKQYPFACDFYIPSKDLYIEYQGYWTHGKEPYNKDNQYHQKIIENWKNKCTPQYNKAIKTWTNIDPLKRKIAIDNGLNWIEFFNQQQFEDWIKYQ